MSKAEKTNSLPLWSGSLILLLALLPLPFGANRPWVADLMGCCVVLIGLGMIRTERKDAPWQKLIDHKSLLLAAFGITIVMLWSVVQVIPWTPSSWHHPIWREASKTLGDLTGVISVDPTGYFETLVRFLSYCLIFVLSLLTGVKREQALPMVKYLSFAGAFYAVYGLLAYASGTETILWYKKWAYHTFLTSTFVNKNSYAAYAGLSLLCSLAYMRQKLKEKWQNHKSQKLPFMTFFEKLSWHELVVLLIPIIIMASLALSGSRAGTISTGCGVAAFFAAMAINKRQKSKKQFMAAAIVFVVFLLFVMIGGHTLVSRFNVENVGQDTAIRMAAYSLTLDAISDNPWFGFGLGTFDTAFRIYRDSSLPVWFHHAHNDYLEMMMDLGIPAALILFAVIGVLISVCVKGVWKRKRDSVYPAAGVAASVLIAVHSLFDFSMHIPAIAALYVALLGLGVGQSWSSRSHLLTLEDEEPFP